MGQLKNNDLVGCQMSTMKTMVSSLFFFPLTPEKNHTRELLKISQFIATWELIQKIIFVFSSCFNFNAVAEHY